MKWRRAIGKAVGTPFWRRQTDSEPEQWQYRLIMDDAASVGEAEWVRRELLPLIALRTPVQLEQRDLLTALAS